MKYFLKILVMCLMIFGMIGSTLYVSAYDVTDFDEADVIYTEFFKTMENYGESGDETELHWLDIMEQTEEIEEYLETFAKTTGKSEQDYLDMTPKDRIIWWATYVEVLNAVSLQNDDGDESDFVISSLDYALASETIDVWNTYICPVCWEMVNASENTENTDRAAAFGKLMELSYIYFCENHSVYNFMEKTDSDALMGREPFHTERITTAEKMESHKMELEESKADTVSNAELNSSLSHLSESDEETATISSDDTEENKTFGDTVANVLNDYNSRTNTEQYRKTMDIIGYVFFIIFIILFIGIPIVTIYDANHQTSLFKTLARKLNIRYDFDSKTMTTNQGNNTSNNTDSSVNLQKSPNSTIEPNYSYLYSQSELINGQPKKQKNTQYNADNNQE